MTTPGLIANRFTIADPGRDLLGRGGMGAVYRATDTQTGETVAVKVLSPEVLARDPGSLERFQREGEALRRLNHPNIVRLVAAVEEDGQQYLVMEYVPGGSLEKKLQREGRLPPEETVRIGLDLADALTRAHRLGILHRDLKPANVLLAADGTPRLSDFGIAHQSGSQRLTETGVLVGTVDFLSPELCQGEPPDERSDIWAFGVLLFQLLSGRLPFEGRTLTARITAILTQPLPDLAQLAPNTPAALSDLVYHMLEKDPAQRVPSVRQVGLELEGIQKGRTGQPDRLHVSPSFAINRTSPGHNSSAIAHSNNLPIQVSSFIGRENEISLIKKVLTHDLTGSQEIGLRSHERLITLVGTGGTGKTRLSLQVAAELLDTFPDGVWFVELAPLSDPSLVASTVAAALSLGQDPHRSPDSILIEHLASRSILLILDNCEHLISACASLADQLFRHCPKLRIIASSREPLNIPSETILHVQPLAVPDIQKLPPLEELSQYEAVCLFFERAQSVQPSVELTNSNALAVAQLCNRLDGIPLAIELAAARLNLLTIEQINNRLRDRFRLLANRSRARLPRHQTLQALIDWSYDLLEETERILFRRLSVFIGNWTLEAVEQICAGAGLDEDEILEQLAGLISKSLVIADVEGSAQARYHFLETIQQYAFNRLDESGEFATIRNQHLEYYINLAESGEIELYGPNQKIWFDLLEAEHGNLRSAIEWAKESNQGLAALRIVGALYYFWWVRGYHTEGLERCKQVLDRFENNIETPELERARAKAYAGAGYLATWAVHDYENGRVLLEKGLSLAKQYNDQHITALSMDCLGFVHIARNDYTHARDLLLEALDIYQSEGDDNLSSRAQLFIGDTLFLENRFSESIPHYKAGIRTLEMIGNTNYLCYAYRRLGYPLLNLGQTHEAKRLFADSLKMNAGLKEHQGVAASLLAFANLAFSQGELKQAARLAGAAEKVLSYYHTHLILIDYIQWQSRSKEFHQHIDKETFDKAWMEGQALTYDHAIELALGKAAEIAS